MERRLLDRCSSAGLLDCRLRRRRSMLTCVLAFGRRTPTDRATRVRRSQVALALAFALRVVKAFRRISAAGRNLGIALNILSKWPENIPPKPVYKRRVVTSTSGDNIKDSSDDKRCEGEPPTKQQRPEQVPW